MSNPDFYNHILKAGACEKREKILELCKGKKVLDVGCVGQDINPDDPNWLHGCIRAVAASVLGVDINTEKMKSLREKGFNMVEPSQLDEQQKQSFDIIVMGDVIEHVDNPVEFLSFYRPFLAAGGKMIVCTPNSFGYRYALGIWLYGKPGINEEHTCWFDPFTLLETVRRAGLRLSDFYWLKEYNKNKRFRDFVLSPIIKFAIFLRKYLHPNFMFIIEAAK